MVLKISMVRDLRYRRQAARLPARLVLTDEEHYQNIPRAFSKHDAKLITRNREIARIPFSWVTSGMSTSPALDVKSRPLAGPME